MNDEIKELVFSLAAAYIRSRQAQVEDNMGGQEARTRTVKNHLEATRLRNKLAKLFNMNSSQVEKLTNDDAAYNVSF